VKVKENKIYTNKNSRRIREKNIRIVST